MRNRLEYNGWVFEDRSAAEGTLAEEMDLTSTSSGVDSISIEVKCADPSIAVFRMNAPMVYTHLQKGVFRRTLYYLQSVSRTGPDHYALYGLTPAGRLTKIPHAGGVYTGQPAEAVIKDICGGLPVIVKTSLREIPIYGWLPYAKPPKSSARDNLAQVLFALGAYLVTDLNGVLRVQSLWSGMSAVANRDRIAQDASASYDPAVTAVSVAEHQYIPGQDEISLFEGTALDGDTIIFSEPAHSLAAEGFSILDSGANWAKLSAGTGILTGKGYIHTTREIREDVTQAAGENVINENSCTLISLVNSRAAAERLADYYRRRETIRCSIATLAERPGYVVGLCHPYDKKIVPACISTMETTVSSILKSELKALVGYTPPQHEQSVGYNRRIVLTGSGTFRVPEGVTHLRGAVIQEGSGGASGLPGEAAPEQKTVSVGEGIVERRLTKYFTAGGKGGKGGLGGSGGKVYQFEMDVEPGQEIAYSCGPGGLGGVYSPDESTPGTPSGAATTFGPYSSASGSVSEGGFLDPITGAVFGTAGEAGVDGGQGSGGGNETNSETPVSGGPVEYLGKTYYAGNATKTVRDTEMTIGKYQWADAAWSEGLGGGAAAGSNGHDGAADGSMSVSSSYARAKGGSAGNGADAAAPAAETRYGCGGRGGNGGGGAGSPGLSEVKHLHNSDVKPLPVVLTLYEATPGQPGRGSQGGRGGPGCVILYFTAYETSPGGALMTGNGRFFLDGLGRIFVI